MGVAQMRGRTDIIFLTLCPQFDKQETDCKGWRHNGYVSSLESCPLLLVTGAISLVLYMTIMSNDVAYLFVTVI